MHDRKPTDNPTDIIAKGKGDFRKRLIYAEKLSAKMIDFLMGYLLRKYPDQIDVIEVYHYGTLAELLKVNL